MCTFDASLIACSLNHSLLATEVKVSSFTDLKYIPHEHMSYIHIYRPMCLYVFAYIYINGYGVHKPWPRYDPYQQQYEGLTVAL